MAELDKQALINAEQWLNSDSINEDIKKEILYSAKQIKDKIAKLKKENVLEQTL